MLLYNFTPTLLINLLLLSARLTSRKRHFNWTLTRRRFYMYVHSGYMWKDIVSYANSDLTISCFMSKNDQTYCKDLFQLCFTIFQLYTWKSSDRMVKYTWKILRLFFIINPLSPNPQKLSNTLKQFVGCCRQIVWVCLTILRCWCFKGYT